MKVSLKIFFLSSLIALPKSDKVKTLDVKFFSMETKASWNYIPKRGIDSFVGAIALDKKDTLEFDYGMYSDDLEEHFDYYVKSGDSLFLRDYEREALMDSVNSPQYKFYSLGGKARLEGLKKCSSHYENIAGLKAKIVVPKVSGVGLIGVYFESTNEKGKGMSLQISGYDLSKKNEELFLKAIKTIKFKK